MRRSRWKRSVLDLLMHRENQMSRFGAKWKEIWSRLGALFPPLPRPGPSGHNGVELVSKCYHLGLESSFTAC